ncbi:MAG: 30S ribosomal protein S20 [Alphaproteobacteria bacterium]
MANHPSAVKRHRQSEKRAERNRVVRSRVRTGVKRARTAIEAGDPGAAAAVASATRDLDKAATKGVIHRNNASRRKARLARAAAKAAKTGA